MIMRTLTSIALVCCWAAAAHAQAKTPAARATVLHVPPGEAPAGEPLRLVAVIDAAVAEPVIVARYRALGGDGEFSEVPFERSSAGGYYATVPAEDVQRPGVEYYIAGRDEAGAELRHFASGGAPFAVRVEPPVLERLAAADEQRMGGRLDAVRFDLDGHNFGNRYGKHDYFVRSELQWTHHFLRRLYAVSFGYGLIEGKTPETEEPEPHVVKRSARYGFSEVRVRLHPSIFLDGRAELGVNREELEVGAAGALTLGRPWRSSVQIGGEAMSSMGPSVFVRLQWDTAPPFLMGASVHKTDLPDAVLEDGLFIRYDINYFIGAIALRGAVSYGSRDGASHWGGGGGVAVSF